MNHNHSNIRRLNNKKAEDHSQLIIIGFSGAGILAFADAMFFAKAGVFVAVVIGLGLIATGLVIAHPGKASKDIGEIGFWRWLVSPFSGGSAAARVKRRHRPRYRH